MDLYFLGYGNRAATVMFNGTTGPENRYTVGGRLWGDIGETSLDYDFEGAYQFGSVGPGNVSAYMLGTSLGYTFTKSSWRPRFWVGYEMGSGDRDTGGDVNTFNQLYPLGHAYFGYIDIVGRQNVG